MAKKMKAEDPDLNTADPARLVPAKRGKKRDIHHKPSETKRKQTKVIRDSFTLPAEDYALLGLLKKKCLALGIEVKKSELVRAGLATLDRLPSEELQQAIAKVERIKTGRPAKHKN